MFSNDNYMVDDLLKLKEYVELFDIVNIQVFDKLLNMNVVVEKINKQEKNEEKMLLEIVLDQIMVEIYLIRDLVR